MDAPTIFLFALLLLIALGVLQLWLWWQDRALIALRTWGISNLMGAVGLTLFIAWSATSNNPLFFDAAGVLGAASYGLAWVGARQFERQPASMMTALLGAAIWLAACQLPQFGDGWGNRVAGASAIFAAYSLLIMREFLRERPSGVLPSRRTLVVIFAAQAVIQVVRAIFALRFEPLATGSPRPIWFGIPTILGVVFLVAASVLLIAVAKEEAEQRSTEALASARDAADRANEAKSQFLARMSHELRTPLNVVLGMAQVFVRDPLLSRIQRERADLLEQAGRHLLSIVNGILDLASIEAGKFELSPRPILVRALINGTIDLVAPSAEEKLINISLEIDDNVPTAVLADPVRVRQIMLNLLSNAIKFAPRGGRVWLSVSRHPSDARLSISIADTGPGIPDDIRQHLFQEFTRLGSGPTSEGTGLGLAISSSLAHAMGGAIRYEPGANGLGSIFVVDLPVPIAEAPADPAPPAVPQCQPGLRVLVVDDVLPNRRLAEAMLQQAGFMVELAADGESAVAALQRGSIPDIILMDVHMPGVDGLMATQRIRALGGSIGQVPIIGLTADASFEKVQSCRAAGMNDYIIKPLDFHELSAAIARIMPGRVTDYASQSSAIRSPSC